MDVSVGEAVPELGAVEGLWPRLRRRWLVLVDVPAARYPNAIVRWRARAIRTMLLFTSATMLLFLPLAALGRPLGGVLRDRSLLASLSVVCSLVVLFWLAGRGPRGMGLVGWILMPGYLLGGVVQAVLGHGILDPAIMSCFSVIMVAALLLGARGALAVGLLSSLGLVLVGVISVLRWSRAPSPPLPAEVQRWLAYSMANTGMFLTVLVLQWESLHRSLLRLAVRNARAERAARSKKDELATFLSVIAHELAGPLTVAKAYLQLSQGRDDVTGEELTRMSQVEQPLLRIERLVRDLRAAAHLDGGFQLTRSPCPLQRVCQTAREHQQQSTGRAITLALPAEPLTVLGDEERLGQVLDNLLGNACSYAPTGEIVLTLRRQEDLAVLSVRDQGPGIPTEHLPRLFQRFYRVPGIHSSTPQRAGLGLGLHICRELVERHGGRIWADSQLGVGTTISLTLPLFEDGGAELAAAPPAAAPAKEPAP